VHVHGDSHPQCLALNLGHEQTRIGPLSLPNPRRLLVLEPRPKGLRRALGGDAEKYASLVDFTFNVKKTGVVCGTIDSSPPIGTSSCKSSCKWGFLKLDAE